MLTCCFHYCTHFLKTWTVAASGSRAGLQLFMLEKQTRKKKNNFSSCFDSSQQYNNYLTQHNACQHRLPPAHLLLHGATARQNQNKCHLSILSAFGAYYCTVFKLYSLLLFV